MNEFKLDQNKVYRLYKLLPDGILELKESGYLYNPGGLIKLNCGVKVGGIHMWYMTSMVIDIEKTGKGCIFETLNSTYILEEA